VYERLLARALRTGKKSVLLLGPRQAGKSTLLRSLAPDWTIDLSSPTTFRDYVREPERLERELDAAPASTRTVLIDEVQRVPALLDAVQHAIDTRRARFRFLLSGSSARKLRRGNANLLPGRVHSLELHPLVAAEIGGEFDVDRALAHGTLPGIYAEADAATRAQDLRGYVDTYLREEIQAEALVRDLGGYARLLDLAAASSGLVLNLMSLCRDAGVGYETARRYLSVMEDTLVAFTVPAWSGSDRASLVSHPKVFLFDAGVRNALLRRPLDRPLDDDRGILMEHLVAYELRRRAGGIWPEARLFHYRSRHGAEVDFVLEVGRELWGIEVKAGRNVDRSQLRGLASLAERARRVHRRIVVFRGPRPMSIDGVEVLPVESFLDSLPRG
jgi:predicted AAA+ superfamily ATPase